MPRLYEYQAKEILKKYGLKVPSGSVTEDAENAEEIHASMANNVFLKAQVKQGKRGKGGLIIRSNNPAETGFTAASLLARIKEEQGEGKILVEESVEFDRELYLSIVSDSKSRQPLVIFSFSGGIEIEEQANSDNVCHYLLNPSKPLYHFEAMNIFRRVKDIGDENLVTLASFLIKLYKVYRDYDCKLIEINPLVYEGKDYLAVDAKMEIDDDALFRQKNLCIEKSSEVGSRKPTLLELSAGSIDDGDHRGSAHFVQIDPEGVDSAENGLIPIGFNSVGTGAALTTMDELIPLGYNPVNFCDTSGNPPASKLYKVTKLILSQPHIKGYMMVSCVSSQQLDNTARGIVKAFLELYPETGGKPNIPCLIALRGALDREGLEIFKQFGIADSPNVALLERDWTEKDAAMTFDKLYRQFKTDNM